MNKWLALFLMITLLVACHRETLSDKAIERFEKVLKPRVTDRYMAGVAEMKIRDQKVIYENDSICLMQCYVDVVDGAGKKEFLEYRYIFLWDTFMSRVMGKMIYNEALLDFPCLSDEQIEFCLKDVKRTGESVYDSLYGETSPLKNE